jgi:hypothetical protein
MAVLIIRLPDDKHDRLRELAKARSVSVDKLIDELATVALANHDARTRFEVRSARGNPRVALELLARLDQVDGEGQIGSGGVEVQRRDLTP